MRCFCLHSHHQRGREGDFMKNTISEKYKRKQGKKKTERKRPHLASATLPFGSAGWLSGILTNAGVFCWPGQQTSEGEEKEVYQADAVCETLWGSLQRNQCRDQDVSVTTQELEKTSCQSCAPDGQTVYFMTNGVGERPLSLAQRRKRTLHCVTDGEATLEVIPTAFHKWCEHPLSQCHHCPR